MSPADQLAQGILSAMQGIPYFIAAAFAWLLLVAAGKYAWRKWLWPDVMPPLKCNCPLCQEARRP